MTVDDEQSNADPTNPSHYKNLNPEPIDVIEAWGFDDDLYIGLVLKYISRFRTKGSPLVDLKKALWYLSRKIKRMEEEQKNRDGGK